MLIPALAIQPLKNRFQRCKGKYLFNVKSLSRVYRARFIQAINKTDISLPVGVPVQWNVHCQPAGQGEESLKYLARYLYRGVVNEHRILSCANGMVELEYLCSTTKQYQRLTLPAAPFLWKILMHVLPRGFQRTRSYGFLHHNRRIVLKRIKLMLRVVLPEVSVDDSNKATVVCPACQQPMKLISAHPETVQILLWVGARQFCCWINVCSLLSAQPTLYKNTKMSFFMHSRACQRIFDSYFHPIQSSSWL